MRPLAIWSAYVACLAVVLGALSWFAMQIVRLERRQWESVAESRAEERKADLVQRAMWRMEYAILPLLNQEASRTWYAYSAFHVGEHAASASELRPAPQRDLFAPSPVLGGDLGFVRLHFQIGGDEKLSSPQIPEGPLAELAFEREVTTRGNVAFAATKLAALSALVKNHPVKRILIGIESAELNAGEAGGLIAEMPTLKQSMQESYARVRQFQSNDQQARSQTSVKSWGSSPRVVYGMMRAFWCGDELLFARHVNVDGEPIVQGCWLDRTSIESKLLSEIRNLLPDAALVPRSVDAASPAGSQLVDQGRSLVGLPYLLEPGSIPVPLDAVEGAGSRTRLFLYLAFASALIAALAVGVVLKVLLDVGERRASFVSAVTHELRTPLTTLRMYAEMLADGRVKADRQPHYFDTLRREADRLAQLVENVLAYSRVEARRTPPKCEAVPLADLVHRASERAAERADRAGMALRVDVDNEDALVMADRGAVEQIVFNLVDNACKYASDTAEKTIEIHASGNGHGARIRVQDHGPGIDAIHAKKLFESFRRPDKAETSGKPGVGLGLALCRRLARSMGGELRYVGTPAGAIFEMELRAGAVAPARG